MSTLLAVKWAHVTLALASVAGFTLRGWWMLRGSVLLDRRWVRVFPHVLDTLLLASGVTLAMGLRVSPLEQAWFAAKLAAIVVYIAAGSIALRRGRSVASRRAALAVALIAAAYVILTATRRSPLPFA